MKRASENELKAMLEENQLDVIFVNRSPFGQNFACIKEYEIKYNIIGNADMKNKYPDDNIRICDFPESDLILPSKNNNSRKFIDEFFDFVEELKQYNGFKTTIKENIYRICKSNRSEDYGKIIISKG